jgi:mRNA interferase RelE/StbE
MNPWVIEFSDAAKKDRAHLDNAQRRQVNAAIYKVAKNPLPKSEGGYGEPLGNKHGHNIKPFITSKT